MARPAAARASALVTMVFRVSGHVRADWSDASLAAASAGQGVVPQRWHPYASCAPVRPVWCLPAVTHQEAAPGRDADRGWSRYALRTFLAFLWKEGIRCQR